MEASPRPFANWRSCQDETEGRTLAASPSRGKRMRGSPRIADTEEGERRGLRTTREKLRKITTYRCIPVGFRGFLVGWLCCVVVESCSWRSRRFVYVKLSRISQLWTIAGMRLASHMVCETLFGNFKYVCLLFDLVTRLEPYGTTWILLDGRRVVAEGSTRCVYAERMHSL